MAKCVGVAGQPHGEKSALIRIGMNENLRSMHFSKRPQLASAGTAQAAALLSTPHPLGSTAN